MPDELPMVGATYQGRRDGRVVTVIGFGGAWVLYRAGATGHGRKNSVMIVNFWAKYKPWPDQVSVATATQPSDDDVARCPRCIGVVMVANRLFAEHNRSVHGSVDGR